MKKNIIFGFLFFLMHAPSFCMEAPIQEEETVPVVLQKDYILIKKLFKEYQLETPEVFLKFLRTELGQEKNPIDYLEQLQILASALLAQHLSMQTLDEIAYLKNSFNQIREQFYMLARKLAKARVSQFAETVDLVPDNDTQLNEVLAHINLVKEKDKIFSDEELKTVFSWALDTSKGEWINNLGKYLILMQEGILIDNQIAQRQDRLADIFSAAYNSPILKTKNVFIVEIRNFLYEAILNLNKYRELLQNPKYQTPEKKKC